MDEPVRIVRHNPAWAASFSSERRLLERAIGQWITGGVHHVGSTAVPGLAAKPIVDILVGVADLPGARGCFAALEALAYCYAPYRPQEMHWFCKPDPARRTHHLHLVPTGSRRYRYELDFRDVLRREPDTARSYERLKLVLAEQHPNDREAYTAGKADFIAEVLARRSPSR